MTPSALTLAPYKPRFHSAVLSVYRYDHLGNGGWLEFRSISTCFHVSIIDSCLMPTHNRYKHPDWSVPNPQLTCRPNTFSRCSFFCVCWLDGLGDWNKLLVNRQQRIWKVSSQQSELRFHEKPSSGPWNWSENSESQERSVVPTYLHPLTGASYQLAKLMLAC